MAARSETPTSNNPCLERHRSATTTGPLLTINPWWDVTQRLLAVLGLLLSVPVLAIAFVLVKTTSRGPFLFRQVRRGYGGEPFCVYKVRSLHVNSEQATALGVASGDASVTRIGRVLRRFKIDELPQMWNIINGTMSLVGPRPTPIALEDELARHIPNFSERHRAKPGLSSFSQVTIVDNRLGSDLVKDWGERFEADMHYIRNKCFAYDLAVIVLTGLYLLRSMLRPVFRSRPNATAN